MYTNANWYDKFIFWQKNVKENVVLFKEITRLHDK